MKKTILSVLLLSAVIVCMAQKEVTTFQIKNGNKPYQSKYCKELNNTIYDVTVHQFINGDYAGEIYVGDVAPGDSTRNITVSNMVEKVKVEGKYVPDHANTLNLDVKFELAGYRYLERGANTVIVIDPKSKVK